jgi:hypothetical protein
MSSAVGAVFIINATAFRKRQKISKEKLLPVRKWFFALMDDHTFGLVRLP